MKNRCKQLLCAALALMLVMAFMPRQAEAATKYTNPATTLKQDTWVTAKGRTDSYDSSSSTTTFTYHLYKITVPANGFTRIYAGTIDANIGVYLAPKSGKAYYESTCVTTLTGAKTYYRVLKKGTYYLYADKGTKIKWNFKSVDNTTNFCRSKATAIKTGVKTTVVFNHGYEYDKWYKLSLTSKKFLYVSIKELDKYGMTIRIYDSKGAYVSASENDGLYKTKSSVAKGTYYIRVRNDSYDSIYGRIAQIAWK